MNVRRLATTAAVAALALALAGFGGCGGDDQDQAWPDEAVAAYVGDAGITEAEVDAVVDDLRQELGAEIEKELERLAEEQDEQAVAEREQQRYGELDEQLAVTRDRVIEMKILTGAADRYIRQEGLEQPDLSQTAVEQQAHQLELSADSAYVQVVAEFHATLSVVQSQVRPAAPTEADQREVYDNLVAEGLTSATFEEAREVLTREAIGEPVGMRNQLAEVIDRAEVRVHPRYDLVYEVPVPVGSGESWLALPLDTSD